MYNQWTWQLGRVRLHLCHGDLFGIIADAFVSSEQSDFWMAWNPSTIGGQIQRRWGYGVQEELQRQTHGETLPPGTVLETGVDGGITLFHAGFHHPSAPLGGRTDDRDTEHLQLIRRCVRDILDRSSAKGISSVAFPLVGCGLFGLDPSLLAYEFFHEVALFSQGSGTRPLEVSLAVLDPQITQKVLQAGVQAWADQLPGAAPWKAFKLGVPLLDEFEQNQVVRTGHAEWGAWMLVRYAELVSSYLLAVIASSVMPRKMPEEGLPVGYPMTFGWVRSLAESLAAHVASDNPWANVAARRFRGVGEDGAMLRRLAEDRNNIAHGRQFRSGDAIRRDLEDWLRPGEWHELAGQFAPPGVGELYPWLADNPMRSEAGVGIFERRDGNKSRYLVPSSGGQFFLP